ncbi:MAG: crosslink repair DNA glycosylase YcaQ family protein [Pseudomonadota bacterium]
MTRPTLSNPLARRLFLAHQGLSPTGPEVPGKAGLLALIEALGFVQVDSINTVERAHHMILSARRQRYRPQHLAPLLERDRTLFEHWTHDAAVIPTAFFPYWRLRFARDRVRLFERLGKWRRGGFEERLDLVLDHIREHGPVKAREVGTDEPRSSGGWWDWHPSKTALEYLWRCGALAITRRDGFQKVFDLTERVIPETVRLAEPSEAEVIDWACTSALDRLGFATSGEIAAFWAAVTPEEAKAWCQARLGHGLIEVDVEMHDGSFRRHVARPDVQEAAEAAPEPPGRLRVLSPFDPALRDRQRAERLFGFHYRIEVFVPAARRRYGYYVFPLLERDRLVGRIDMKRDGAGGPLVVQALWPERGVRFGKARTARLETELARVARVSGCVALTFEDGWRRDPLG